MQEWLNYSEISIHTSVKLSMYICNASCNETVIPMDEHVYYSERFVGKTKRNISIKEKLKCKKSSKIQKRKQNHKNKWWSLKGPVFSKQLPKVGTPDTGYISSLVT